MRAHAWQCQSSADLYPPKQGAHTHHDTEWLNWMLEKSLCTLDKSRPVTAKGSCWTNVVVSSCTWLSQTDMISRWVCRVCMSIAMRQWMHSSRCPYREKPVQSTGIYCQCKVCTWRTWRLVLELWCSRLALHKHAWLDLPREVDMIVRS